MISTPTETAVRFISDGEKIFFAELLKSSNPKNIIKNEIIKAEIYSARP